MAEKYPLGVATTPWDRKIEYMDGVPIDLEHHSIELVTEVMNLEYKKDDIVICTYPKAGTTFTQEIVWLVMNQGDTEAAGKEYISARIPYLEFSGPALSKILSTRETNINLFLRQTSPRMGKTHLPWNLGPGNVTDSGARLIYCMRNPKDTAVSYYHFSHAFADGGFRGPFTDFVKFYFAPGMSYGNIFDHYLSFWKERHRPNVLILYYEDLVHDHRAQVVKIANFLEQKLSDETIDRIVAATTYESMKRNPMTNYEFVDAFRKVPFMRKGQTGDWKNNFPEDLSTAVDDLINRKLTSVGIKY